MFHPVPVFVVLIGEPCLGSERLTGRGLTCLDNTPLVVNGELVEWIGIRTSGMLCESVDGGRKLQSVHG